MMMQARPGSDIPVELRLDNTLVKSHGLTNVLLTCALSLKWAWWHTRSYLPIVVVLLLSFGSLLVLQLHWLHRRLVYTPTKAKAILEDMG